MSKRIHLWSGPRNLSTALMYSFAQRPDTRVVDEPLYAHYLKVSGADHPGRDEVLQSMESDGRKVIREVLLGGYNREIVFFKQMTHHLMGLDLDFLETAHHIIQIREPREVLTSYSKVIEKPDLFDIGIQQAEGLWNYLNERDVPVALLDAGDLAREPEVTLMQLCHNLRIPFYPEMLSWEPGARPEDGVWAKFWYHGVHQSSGFRPLSGAHPELPHELQDVFEQAQPIYERLYSQLNK